MNRHRLCLVLTMALLAGCGKSNPSSPDGKTGFTLTIEVASALGTVTVSPEKNFYSARDTVTLNVVPKGKYIFRGWSGDIIDSSKNVRVVMNTDKKISADFQRQINGPKLLTLSIQATKGTINYGTSPVTFDSVAGVFVCDSGAEVNFTVKPDSGCLFVCWKGDTTLNTPAITLRVVGFIALSTECVQNSTPAIFDTVQVKIIGGAGRVDFHPAAGRVFFSGDSGTADSTFIFPHGEHLVAIAKPYIDWKFTTWGGNLSGGNDTSNLDVNGNRNITATFVKDSPGPAFVGSWNVFGWTFLSAYGGDILYTSAGDSCHLDIRADGTFTGWSIHYYSIKYSTGSWIADNSYIYFSSSDGWDEQVIWEVSKGEYSASLTLIVVGDSGEIHEMCARGD